MQLDLFLTTNFTQSGISLMKSERTKISLVSYDSDDLDNGFKPIFRKVIYKTSDQKKLIDDYLDSILEGYKNGINGKISGAVEENYHSAVMGSQASNIFLDLILSFKNPAFSEEKEWRLINVILDHDEPDKLKFRENDFGLIPYRQSYLYCIKDDLKVFPLKSIVLGPSLDQESQTSAIQLYLNHSSSLENNITIENPGTIWVKSAGYELK